MLVVALVSFSLFNFVGDPINNMVGEETSDEERELEIRNPADARKFVSLLEDSQCRGELEQGGNIHDMPEPSEFQKVDQLFRNSGFNLVNSEVAYLASSSVNLDIEKFNRLSKLIEALEDLDDVQNVYANFDIDNKLLEKAITE